MKKARKKVWEKEVQSWEDLKMKKHRGKAKDESNETREDEKEKWRKGLRT